MPTYTTSGIGTYTFTVATTKVDLTGVSTVNIGLSELRQIIGRDINFTVLVEKNDFATFVEFVANYRYGNFPCLDDEERITFINDTVAFYHDMGHIWQHGYPINRYQHKEYKEHYRLIISYDVGL
jgi:hypothetical protein